MLTRCTGRWMMQRISVHSWSILQAVQANNMEEAFWVKVQAERPAAAQLPLGETDN